MIYYSISGSYLPGKPRTPKFSDSNQSRPKYGCTPECVVFLMWCALVGQLESLPDLLELYPQHTQGVQGQDRDHQERPLDILSSHLGRKAKVT